MAGLSYPQYVDGRKRVWQQMGFKLLEVPGAGLVFRRRKFSFAKFGMVDTFCIVADAGQTLTPGFVAQFSGNAFKLALKNKFFLPRGFGATAIAYPLFVTENVAEDVKSFIKQYTPKHYASFEFPVIFDLATQQLTFFDGTPAWGAAYYRGFRKEAQTLFGVNP